MLTELGRGRGVCPKQLRLFADPPALEGVLPGVGGATLTPPLQVLMELADLAKRDNDIAQARNWFAPPPATAATSLP
jgi:hypothetical protein